MKRILFFLLIVLCCASLAYAGNESTFGVSNDSYSGSGVEVYGGGSNAIIGTPYSGVNAVRTLEQPGYIKLWSYDPTGATLTAYYLWVGPSGDLKISSGASGANAYSTPNTANFDLETSGQTVGSQS